MPKSKMKAVEDSRPMKNKLSSRKILVLAIGFIIGIVLAYLGKLDRVTADFIIYMVGVYIVGNVGTHVASAFRRRQ